LIMSHHHNKYRADQVKACHREVTLPMSAIISATTDRQPHLSQVQDMYQM
jgi:hypothetical protein